MRISRFRRKILFLIIFSLMGIFIFHSLSSQLYRHGIDVYKTGIHSDPPRNLEKQPGTQRKNLIIVSHGRSGSTLTGDIFNHHPSVFYMYEPLQSAQRVNKNVQNMTYSGLVEQYLKGVFRCTFDQPQILADIERYYRKPDHPRLSQAIASPPLCPYRTTDPRWHQTHCHPLTIESLGSACKDNYDLTVLKILMSRLPDKSIETILTACNTDCKIVFLVRDPRAVIASSLSVGFYKEKGDSKAKLGTRLFSYWQCKQTEDNLEFIRNLPATIRRKIKLQRYEDLALNPLKELSGLYEFAGLAVLESVRKWLNETTQLSRKACKQEIDGEAVTCTKDDAWAAVNRWRWKVHPHDIDIIEYYCGRVMRLMGYRLVERSYQLLLNVKTPLLSDDFQAKHWF